MKLPGNMQAMMKQAEQMQKKLQEEIALIRVEATAGGGVDAGLFGGVGFGGVELPPPPRFASASSMGSNLPA